MSPLENMLIRTWKHFFSLYRLDFVLRDQGLVVVAILAARKPDSVLNGLVVLIMHILVQMHSFSANDLQDHLAWDEANALGHFHARYGLIVSQILVHLPLLPLAVLALISPHPAHFLLLLYILLFAGYQMQPFRWKHHYVPSLFINALCLGTIPFLHPYLVLRNDLDLAGALFSVLFFCYLAFHEVVHQLAHWGEDDIVSLPSALGLRGAGRTSLAFLLAALGFAISGLLLVPGHRWAFFVAIGFTLLRLLLVARADWSKAYFAGLRASWHKSYSLHEGGCYVVLYLFGSIFQM